jgi:hypothetical protein
MVSDSMFDEHVFRGMLFNRVYGLGDGFIHQAAHCVYLMICTMQQVNTSAYFYQCAFVSVTSKSYCLFGGQDYIKIGPHDD